MSHHRHLNASSPRSPGGEGRGWEASGGAMVAGRGAMVAMGGGAMVLIPLDPTFGRQLHVSLVQTMTNCNGYIGDDTSSMSYS